jgi:hypothetical protein
VVLVWKTIEPMDMEEGIGMAADDDIGMSIILLFEADERRATRY